MTAATTRPPVFVLGGRDSGAREIAMALGQLPGAVVAMPDGSHLLSQGIAPVVGNFDVGLDNGLNALVDRSTLMSAVRALADDLLTSPAPEGSLLIDHSPSDVAYAAIIAEVYPDAHLVCVVRDGRDVVAAAAGWRDAVRSARAWCRSARIVLGLAGGELVRVVRVEDVGAEPTGALASLAAWIGASGTPAFVDEPPPRARRRAARTALVEALGADLLTGLGYPISERALPRARRAPWRAIGRARGWLL